MGWRNVIVGSRDLHNSYNNAVKSIAIFVGTTTPVNIITNDTIMAQYTINQGLQVSRVNGEAAVRKKLQQVHDQGVVEPKKHHGLTYAQLKKVLEYLMFIKIKNDEVMIKRRGCADGRKQRNWLPKEYTIPPTVSIEGLMLSCIIDVMEGCDVATADIPGVFLQTDYDIGGIPIKMECAMATLME